VLEVEPTRLYWFDHSDPTWLIETPDPVEIVLQLQDRVTFVELFYTQTQFGYIGPEHTHTTKAKRDYERLCRKSPHNYTWMKPVGNVELRRSTSTAIHKAQLSSYIIFYRQPVEIRIELPSDSRVDPRKILQHPAVQMQRVCSWHGGEVSYCGTISRGEAV
jgi:hypothetical protein